QRTVTRLLSPRAFDVIMVHCSSMGPYVAGSTAARRIMDFGDADSEKWLEYSRSAPFPLSLAFRAEARRVRRQERRLADRFDVRSVTAPREREVLAAYVPGAIHVLPNGVDLDYFQPQRPPGQSYAPDRLIFTGNMSYKPNVEAVHHFVSDILPTIWRRRPRTEFFIVGMDPTHSVRRLADGLRVVVTGRVDDVRPYFDDAAVAVAPLRVARGLQNKVLEAMAMRVPVVASPAAANGIHAVAGRDLLVEREPEAFGHAVVSLLDDRAMRERYASAARACVEANHDWGRILRRLDDLVVGDAPGPERSPSAEAIR
ncbi:MAG: TIGR03087 family PEP-CTERM/XrtA system glycosyltransferase, partial [Candidatus Rokuibacteriota bacterium]